MPYNFKICTLNVRLLEKFEGMFFIYCFRFLEELRNETMGYYDIFPHRWLRNKYRQLGLEVFTHTFKLTFPLGPNSKRSNTTGKNIYGNSNLKNSLCNHLLLLFFSNPKSAKGK